MVPVGATCGNLEAMFSKRLLVIVGVLVLLATGCARPSAQLAAYRVKATPVPTPTPSPTPVPVPDDVYENSGSGISWVPSRNAGPFETGGSIEVAAIGASAKIVRVGVAMNSQMVVPKNALDVAWLDQGPYPGTTQNVVLAGHISWGGRLGTFNRLQALSAGDPIVVTMDGIRYTYRTIWQRTVDRNTEDVLKIMGFTEVPSVTLITCGGAFDRRAGTHVGRVVARGQLVSSEPV